MTNSSSLSSEQKNHALYRILQIASTKSAQLVMYASSLGAIALLPRADIPSVLAGIAGGVGVNLLSGIIERVARGDGISDIKILKQVEDAIAQSGIEGLIATSQEIRDQITHLSSWQQHLAYVIQSGNEQLSIMLIQQYGQLEELQADVKQVLAQLEQLAESNMNKDAKSEVKPTTRKPITHLEFLQTLDKEELIELVLIPLFSELGYHDIRRIFGQYEYGCDIVFTTFDPIDGIKYFGIIVKRQELTESILESQGVREVLFQVQHAITKPFINPFDGQEITLSRVYLLTPFSISQTCSSSIQSELQLHSSRVNFIDGPKLLDLLKKYLPSLLSSLPDSKLKYFHILVNRFLKSQTSLLLGASKEFNLRDIYITGRLSPTTLDEAKYISFVSIALDDMENPISEVISKNRFCVILADVGAGKTTLLQMLTLDIISLADGSVNPNVDTLPLFVPLSLFSESFLQSYDVFIGKMTEYIRKDGGYSDFDIKVAHKYILLLDGFDEIQTNHKLLTEYIQKLAGYFTSGIIITSRPSRPPNLLKPFTYYRLNHLSNQDILDFLRKWFIDDECRAEELYETILRNEMLYRFCKTPLMLTLYAVLATAHTINSLPTRKTDVYTSIAKLLLGDWDRMRSVHNYFSSDIKEICLERLAFGSQVHRQMQFTREELERTIMALLDSAHIDKSSNSILFDELLFRSSLIKHSGRGNYEFVHLSLQEFFCAKYLMRSAASKELELFIYDDWWKNTMLFYFGLVQSLDHVRIIQRKAEGNVQKLMEYLSEAEYTSQDQREAIYKVMAKDILNSKNITAGMVEACLPQMNAFLPFLQSAASSFFGNPYNYFKFLIKTNLLVDKWSAQDTSILDQLDFEQTLEILTELINSYSKQNFRKILLEGLDTLINKSKDKIREYRGMNLILRQSELAMLHKKINILQKSIEDPVTDKVLGKGDRKTISNKFNKIKEFLTT